MAVKPILPEDLHNKKYLDFWNEHFLPVGFPLLLGLVLGPLLALLIVKEAWIFALPLVALVPMAVLIIRYPFAAILIWMVTLPFFPNDDTFKYVYYIFHRALIPLVFGITILSRMLKLKKYPSVKLGRAEFSMVVFAAIGVISILVAGDNLKLMAYFYVRIFVPFVAYWLVQSFSPREQDVKRLLPAMLLLVVAECVIGLLGWFVPDVLPSIWISRLVGERVVGTFSQSEIYGFVVAYCIVFLYHYAMNLKKGLVRLLLLLICGLGMVCIFFTFTRSAWVGGLLVLLGLLFLYPKPTLVLLLIILPIMLILGQGVLANEFAHAADRLHTEGSIEDRVILANAARQMFYARPFFGWGYAQYDRYDWEFIERVGDIATTKWQIQTGTSHNTFLTILAEMGAIGFFFYYFPVIWWLGLTIKVLRRLPKKGFWSWRLLIIMWLPIAFQLVTSQTVDYRFFVFPVTLLWLTLGLIASIVRQYLEPTDMEISGRFRRVAPVAQHP